MGAAIYSFPLEALIYCINSAMSATVKPDIFAAEVMKLVMAVAKLLVPAVDDIALFPIIPPMTMDI